MLKKKQGKNVGKKFWEKKCWKKFGQKTFWKNKIQNKNIFTLFLPCQHPSTKEGGKRLWHMIQSRQCRALALDAKNVAV